ncbi:hypothetical protein OWR21_02730 [Ralstonia sp. 1B3]
MIFADRLVAILPTGEVHTILEDGNKEATAAFEAAFSTGEIVPMGIIEKTGGKIAPWITSVTFGGPDLRTVFWVASNTIQSLVFALPLRACQWRIGESRRAPSVNGNLLFDTNEHL